MKGKEPPLVGADRAELRGLQSVGRDPSRRVALRELVLSFAVAFADDWLFAISSWVVTTPHL
jgi:hypothetical protein